MTKKELPKNAAQSYPLKLSHLSKGKVCLLPTLRCTFLRHSKSGNMSGWSPTIILVLGYLQKSHQKWDHTICTRNSIWAFFHGFLRPKTQWLSNGSVSFEFPRCVQRLDQLLDFSKFHPSSCLLPNASASCVTPRNT